MTRTVAVDRDAPAPAAVAEALDLLRAGELLIFATETLYGLGGLALRPGTAARVRAAKGRPDAQPLPLVAADEDQARALCAAWPDAAAALAARFWPGPLTLVLPASPAVPGEVGAGSGTVAVRVPGLALPRALCAAGPLISTSANRTGEPPPLDCPQAVAAVGHAAALALDAGRGLGQASTIVDLGRGAPRLLREGAVPAPALAEVLGRLLLE